MRLNEIEESKLLSVGDGIYESNKVWIIPIRVLGTARLQTNREPTVAWIELDKGDHVIADGGSDIAYEKLGPDDLLVMVEVVSDLPCK